MICIITLKNNKEFLNLNAKVQTSYPLKVFVLAILFHDRRVAKFDFSCVNMQLKKKNHSQALFPLGLSVECSCTCVVGGSEMFISSPFAY